MEMERTTQTTTTMTEQYLRRKTLSSSSSYFQSAKKNPLHPNKDGRQRTDNDESISTINSGSHHREPLDDNVVYFPDHIARVSYIASVVRPEANGDYLDELQGGMKLLATRLAPSYFPGTIVRQITTQVDGYYPSGEFWALSIILHRFIMGLLNIPLISFPGFIHCSLSIYKIWQLSRRDRLDWSLPECSSWRWR